MVVENHQVDRQLLHPPVLVGLQQLAHDLQIRDVVDPADDDRHVAGDAVRPQHGRRPLTACQDVGGRAERRVRVEHVAGQTLEQAGLVGTDAEVEQLDVRLRPRQGAGTLERGGIVVLVGQVEHGLARTRDERPERDVRGGPGRQPDAPAQAEDRIEHGAGRIGEGPAVDDRDWRADAAAAPQEACPVGFEFSAAGRLPFDDGQVGRPDGRLVGRPAPTRGEHRTDLGDELGLHEQLGEGGMGRIGCVGGQDDLRVRRHVDLAGPASLVPDRHPARLGIVFGRHHHFQSGRHRPVAPDHVDPVFEERGLVFVGFDAAGLVAGRPHGATLDVAEEHVGAPAVARRVLAPARDGEVTPTAVARPHRRHHHRIPAVGEQLCLGDGLMRGRETAGRRRHELVHARRGLPSLAPGTRGIHLARRAFVQEEFGRLDDRLGVKTGAHRAVVEHVGERDQGHALVVRHVRADDGHLLAFGKPGRRVVQRLVPAVAAGRAFTRQMREVLHRRFGRDHRGERRRVRGHHGVVAETTLESEAGDTEAPGTDT